MVLSHLFTFTGTALRLGLRRQAPTHSHSQPLYIVIGIGLPCVPTTMTDRTTDHFRGRHYTADHISGPIAFLNPTTRLLPLQRAQDKGKAKYDDENKPAGGRTQTGPQVSASPEGGPSPPEPAEQEQQQKHHPGIYHVWRSRDNRKGRHALALTPSTAAAAAATTSSSHHQPTNTLRGTLAGVSRMTLRYPVWDVSYDVAAVFTLGSVVWVLNGFFVLLPLTDPGSAWPGESLWGGGVTAMVGATIFVAGSVLLMLEAVNENRSECFGWALEGALGRGEEDLVLRRDESGCRHHHRERRSFLTGKSVADVYDDDDDAKGFVEGKGREGGGDSEEGGAPSDKGRRRWTWWPSWYELRTHYFHDIGFLACLSQMIGATIFWMAGFTSLPQILGALTVPATNGTYWLPQVSCHLSAGQSPSPPPNQIKIACGSFAPQGVCTRDFYTDTSDQGRWRHRFHRFFLTLHARDATKLVHPLTHDPGLAHWFLEPDWGHRLYLVRCPGFRQQQ